MILRHACIGRPSTDAAIEQRVADILADVQQRGDAAVLEYTARFDRPQRTSHGRAGADPGRAQGRLRQPARQCSATHSQAAARRVSQLPRGAERRPRGRSWSYRDEDGTLLGQKVTPLDRVGIYVPGGKAAYPSRVLMNAIPAHVAGVDEIIMVVPTPRARGTRWCWLPPTWPV